MLRSDVAERELREALLTYRLLCHGARTQTICRFTSLTTRQVETYRHRWGFKKKDRSRGPSPSSFIIFFRSHSTRVEGAHLAQLCKTHQLLSDDVNKPTYYTFTIADQLCDVLDLHKATFAEPTYSFDQL